LRENEGFSAKTDQLHFFNFTVLTKNGFIKYIIRNNLQNCYKICKDHFIKNFEYKVILLIK